MHFTSAILWPFHNFIVIKLARQSTIQIWNILFTRVESPTPLDSIIEEKQIGRRSSGPLVTRKLEQSVALPCRTSAGPCPPCPGHHGTQHAVTASNRHIYNALRLLPLTHRRIYSETSASIPIAEL